MTTENRRHKMLNAEWWTLGRKVKGLCVGIATIAAAIFAIVQISDLYANRVDYPKHRACFVKLNDSINGPEFAKQRAINQTIIMASLKTQAYQEVLMGERQKQIAEENFRRDSLKLYRFISEK